MSHSTATIEVRHITSVVSNTGMLKNEHFFLTANHLMLDLDQATFELVAARAEGNIHIHLLNKDGVIDYIAMGQSAIYMPERQRITLNGWSGSHYRGVDYPPETRHREVTVPTDGSFFVPKQADESDEACTGA
jgi:hypothetical protein